MVFREPLFSVRPELLTLRGQHHLDSRPPPALVQRSYVDQAWEPLEVRGLLVSRQPLEEAQPRLQPCSPAPPGAPAMFPGMSCCRFDSCRRCALSSLLPGPTLLSLRFFPVTWGHGAAQLSWPGILGGVCSESSR